VQGNDTDIIIVTEKVKAFIGKFRAVSQKTIKKHLEIFSRLKDFVEENNLETSNTVIDHYIKDRLVNLQSRFSKYFPKAVRDKKNGSQFHSMSIVLKKKKKKKKKTKAILILYLTLRI
jgi:hypothetical protein